MYLHLNYAEIHTDTLEEAFQSKKQPGEKKFHNLKYIEKVAELSADALADNIRSGGSTNDNSTTIYNSIRFIFTCQATRRRFYSNA